MTLKKMTHNEIKARIDSGELVVYLSEEYGYRNWFWFPQMSEEKLLEYWDGINIKDYFFDPSGLSGDMIPVPIEEEYANMTPSQIAEREDEAFADKRGLILSSAEFKEGSKVFRDWAIKEYDEWRKEFFPIEAFWSEGFRNKSCWRAHTHEKDDSWLKPNSKCMSPDEVCHYYTITDRDGVSCVELENGTLDHNFPRDKWSPDSEDENKCLYCG